MNSLNSILLEGVVKGEPSLMETSRGTSYCTFTIVSNRRYRSDEKIEDEISHFEIETWGKLAETCGTNCVNDRGVRIVGRLRQDKDKVKVIAEHIEFKPIKKALNTPEVEF